MTSADIAFDHNPIRPARAGCIGEQVYLKNWQELVTFDSGYHPDYEGPNGILEHIVSPGDGILTQRHATVAASLLRWLGTNNGRGFLQQAFLMGDCLGDRQEGYLAQWAIENRRDRSVNSGMRSLESVMKEPGADKSPKLSADDCETMERVIIWLASDYGFFMPTGQQFLKKCMADVDAELKLQRSRERTARESTTIWSQPHDLASR